MAGDLIELDHAAFLIALGLYCVLGATFFWSLLQFLALRRQGLAREATLMATPLPPDEALPRVLVQVPIFNEGALAGRICAALSRLDWPSARLKVQLLDDSTEGGGSESERAAGVLRGGGVEAEVLRRTERRGYKAGALADGLLGSGEPFVAVFDADYVPPPDFLKSCARPLLADPGLALVQARCDYLNPDENALTRAQRRILDAHYAIEQPARSWSGQIVPFNGTCGVWRRRAIDDAGGWQGDTLAEDMDLSFRAQLRGWRALFLYGVTAPGELPTDWRAWRRQQRRWSKGSGQVTRKLLLALWGSNLSVGRKITSTLSLGGGLFGPLFAVCLAFGAADLTLLGRLSALAVTLLALLAVEILVGPMLLQAAAQRYARGANFLAELAGAPMMLVFQLALGFISLAAGLESLAGGRRDFERTPKAASAAHDWRASPEEA